MQQKVDLSKLGLGLCNNCGNVLVLLHVERHDELRRLWKCIRAFRYPQSILLPRIVRLVRQMTETTDAAFLHDNLRDGPGERTVIGDAEYQPLFSIEHSHRDASESCRCRYLAQNIAGPRKMGHGVRQWNPSDFTVRSNWCQRVVSCVVKTITLCLGFIGSK